MNTSTFFLADSAISQIDISTTSGKLSMGLQTMLLGMLIVFSVLAVLWLSLLLFKVFFYTLPNKAHHQKKEPTLTAVVKEAPASMTPAACADAELVAAITAAIAAAQSEESTARFRVVAFRRIR